MPLLDPVYVSFPKLWDEVGGNCSFGLDKVIKMLAEQDDINVELLAKKKKPEDFKFIHGESLFIIPYSKITEYFATNEKPDRPLGPDEQIKFLTAQVAKLKKELKGEVKIAKAIPSDELDAPIVESTKETVVPKQDKEIPKSDTGASMKEIQQQWKDDPKMKAKVKPVSSEQRAQAATKSAKRPIAKE